MDEDRSRAGIGEGGDVAVGMREHQVDAEREAGRLPRHGDDIRAEAEIRDEVPVHDIEMEGIGPGGFGASRLRRQGSHVCRKQGRKDDDRFHGV